MLGVIKVNFAFTLNSQARLLGADKLAAVAYDAFIAFLCGQRPKGSALASVSLHLSFSHYG